MNQFLSDDAVSGDEWMALRSLAFGANPGTIAKPIRERRNLWPWFGWAWMAHRLPRRDLMCCRLGTNPGKTDLQASELRYRRLFSYAIATSKFALFMVLDETPLNRLEAACRELNASWKAERKPLPRSGCS
jgi:hypothetical protein